MVKKWVASTRSRGSASPPPPQELAVDEIQGRQVQEAAQGLHALLQGTPGASQVGQSRYVALDAGDSIRGPFPPLPSQSSPSAASARSSARCGESSTTMKRPSTPIPRPPPLLPTTSRADSKHAPTAPSVTDSPSIDVSSYPSSLLLAVSSSYLACWIAALLRTRASSSSCDGPSRWSHRSSSRGDRASTGPGWWWFFDARGSGGPRPSRLASWPRAWSRRGWRGTWRCGCRQLRRQRTWLRRSPCRRRRWLRHGPFAVRGGRWCRR